MQTLQKTPYPDLEIKLQKAEQTFEEIQELHRKFALIAAILSRMIADSTAFYNARKQK